MRRVVAAAVLPLLLLAACHSAPPSSSTRGKPCTQRVIDSGQCEGSSISSFPELANVQ